jgi:hypothetical protein
MHMVLQWWWCRNCSAQSAAYVQQKRLLADIAYCPVAAGMVPVQLWWQLLLWRSGVCGPGVQQGCSAADP